MTYSVNGEGGYVADVSYTGEAQVFLAVLYWSSYGHRGVLHGECDNIFSVPTGASWRLWEEVGTNQTASTPLVPPHNTNIEAFKSLTHFIRISLIIRLNLVKRMTRDLKA